MKKYSIRYSNRGIAILISTLLILANVFIFTAKIKPIIPEINHCLLYTSDAADE